MSCHDILSKYTMYFDNNNCTYTSFNQNINTLPRYILVNNNHCFSFQTHCSIINAYWVRKYKTIKSINGLHRSDIKLWKTKEMRRRRWEEEYKVSLLFLRGYISFSSFTRYVSNWILVETQSNFSWKLLYF